MIYDLRTYLLRPRGAPEFSKRFEAGLAFREKFSPLGAFFTTEVGTLNEVVHIWPYESIAQAEQVRADLSKSSSQDWPPKADDLILQMRSEYLSSTPLMKDWNGPQNLGNVYELRTYTYRAGTLPAVINEWQKILPKREAYSPIAGAWINAQGSNKFYHLWPYSNLDERSQIRAASVAAGDWPPNTSDMMLYQENKILIPSNFSPLH